MGKLPPSPRVLAWCAWLSLAGILYLTLLPFQFGEVSLARAWEIYLSISVPEPASINYPQWFANVVMFLPLGFFWAAWLGWRVRRRVGRLVVVAGVALLALAVTCVVEFLQIWLPYRYPAIADISANFLGGVLGGVLWLLLWPRFEAAVAAGRTAQEGRLRRQLCHAAEGVERAREPLRRALVWICPGYILLLVAFHHGFGPYHLEGEWAWERRSVIRWIPFYAHYHVSEWAALRSVLAHLALYIPLGGAVWLLSRRPAQRFGQLGLMAALCAGLVATGMEAGKLFLVTGRPDTSGVVIAVVAAVTTAWLLGALSRQNPALRGGSPPGGRSDR
ncbi:VanZ family protein [Halorhodospira halophila]|uniref:VanZ family protein n=1 Tax=Halorhodospira halophila TaxID=1053 RepID=UPI0019147084|nr:VanZ family protein [Halorhodospira halophila]MBK5936118.1 hypothetical protein [Halorhodospira halophila]